MAEYIYSRPITVLHVEDNVTDAIYVKSVLDHIRGCRFIVRHARTLAEAVQSVAGDSGIDVVLLDLMLPDSEGLDTVRKVHEAAPAKPIVMLTGEGDESLILEGLHLVAQDYIGKTEIRPELIKRVVIAAIDRKAAQEALRRSEQRFQLAVAATSEGIWDWDIANGVFWISPQYYRLLGYDEEAFPASLDAWKRCLHPDEREAVWSDLQHYLESRTTGVFNIEHRMQIRGGGHRWFLTRGRAVWDSRGRPVRMAGSMADIDERRHLEEELALARERCRLSVRSAGVGLWEWEIGSDELYWSDRLRTMLGVSAGAFVPRFEFMQSRVHPRDRRAFDEAIERHLAEGVRCEIRCRMRHHDGRYLLMHGFAQAVRSEQGRPERMAGTLADVTAAGEGESAGSC